MHLIKPSWLVHGGEKKDFEIYSADISPDGKRLVTAAGDGQIRIWSMDAIRNANNPDYKGPRQLCHLSYHSGVIHTVRFSPNNKYLASGADDKIVCIYTLDPTPASHATFGSNETPPVENWRIFRRLFGHEVDVQDLGWSYDSSILVSVGLDSRIVVWSGFTFEKLKTIGEHRSHVKGITFDPANKYFATASDDRTVKIFRFNPPNANSTAQDQSHNFQLESTVKESFISSPLTTYFRRCSWSPDGNHIACANATNGPVSSIAIINRGTWDAPINLIGHEGPIEVCAFAQRLFCAEKPKEGGKNAKGDDLETNTVIACAGQDKCLSIWNTCSARPLAVIQDVSIKSIVDITWSPDADMLVAVSLDGSALACIFEEGDIGFVAPTAENEKQLAKFGAGRRAAGIIEGPDGLVLEEQSKQGEVKGAEGRMGELMGDDSKPAPATNGTGTSTPKLIPILTNGSETKTNGVSTPKPLDASTPISNAPTPPAAPESSAHAAKLEKLKQRVTITADGKRRIQPLLVSSSSVSAQSLLPRSQILASNTQKPVDSPQAVLDLSKPFAGLPQGGLSALLLGNKRKYAALGEGQDGRTEKRVQTVANNGGTAILSTTPNGLVMADGVPATDIAQPTPEYIRPAVINPSLSVSQVRLAVPKVRSVVSSSIDDPKPLTNGALTNGTSEKSAEEKTVFEARNTASTTGRLQDRDPTRIVVTRRSQVLWQDYLPKNVLLSTGSRNFWAAACEEGSIYTWTPAGRRLMNALVLEAQPVILECRGWFLLCVTAAGMAYVWNMRTMAAPHPPVSLAPILDIGSSVLQAQPVSAPAVTSAHLNSQGHIVVTLSNGGGYFYSPLLYTWQRVSEPWWAYGSQYWNTTDYSVTNVQSSASDHGGDTIDNGEVSAANVSAGIIPQLERNTTQETLLRGRSRFLAGLMKSLISREGFEGFESSVSIAHLENRIAGALALGAKEEFRVYLYMYAKRLGVEGQRTKVEELLRGLLGSLYEPERDKEIPKDIGRGWQADDGEICGWDRMELLKGVILILGKHRDLQRITVPYASVIRLLDQQSKDEEMVL